MRFFLCAVTFVQEAKFGQRRLGAWDEWCKTGGRDVDRRIKSLMARECESEEEDVPVIVETVEEEEVSLKEGYRDDWVDGGHSEGSEEGEMDGVVGVSLSR